MKRLVVFLFVVNLCALLFKSSNRNIQTTVIYITNYNAPKEVVIKSTPIVETEAKVSQIVTEEEISTKVPEEEIIIEEEVQNESLSKILFSLKNVNFTNFAYSYM